MKKKVFFYTNIVAVIVGLGICPLAMARPLSHSISAYFHSDFGALTFLPTALPALTVKFITSLTANQAVLAAQEPAFLVLNGQEGAEENPLFKNAVSEIIKDNEHLKSLNDQQMAAIILNIGESISSN
ncbi:MAG: hypothetical protein ACXVCY_12270 [Pseudobdellovibrionaceae bacterium]